MNIMIANLRAARSFLGINQSEVAQTTSLDVNTISKTELEKNSPTSTTLMQLRAFYEERGIVFTENGIRFEPYKVSTIDNFMTILDDAEQSLKKGQEILMHCADERRNSDEVTEKLNALRAKGIRIRMTCEEGNTIITGKADDYKWIDPELYASSQVEVIYGDKFYFHFRDAGRDFFVLTKSKEKARTAKRQFDYQWKRGNDVKTS